MSLLQEQFHSMSFSYLIPSDIDALLPLAVALLISVL